MEDIPGFLYVNKKASSYVWVSQNLCSLKYYLLDTGYAKLYDSLCGLNEDRNMPVLA